MAPVQLQMCKKGGKSVLIKSVNTKVFFTLKSPDHTIAENCELAAKACPVKIISVKET
jgi:ferredoxin